MRASRPSSRSAACCTASGSPAAVDLLAQQLDLVGLALAQLVLNGLELLAQVVLPLRVGHLLLRLRLDLALHLEQRDLAGQRGRHRLQLRQERVGLEQRLLVGDRHVEQAAEQVRQAQRVVEVGDDAAQFLRQAAGQRQRLVHLLLDAAHVGVDFERLVGDLGQQR